MVLKISSCLKFMARSYEQFCPKHKAGWPAGTACTQNA